MTWRTSTTCSRSPRRACATSSAPTTSTRPAPAGRRHARRRPARGSAPRCWWCTASGTDHPGRARPPGRPGAGRASSAAPRPRGQPLLQQPRHRRPAVRRRLGGRPTRRRHELRPVRPPARSTGCARSATPAWTGSVTACRCMHAGDALYVGHFGPSGMGTSDPRRLRPHVAAAGPAVAVARRKSHPQGPGGRRTAARQPRAVPRRRPLLRRHGRLRPQRPLRPASRWGGSTRPARACTGSCGPEAATPTSPRSPRASTTGSGSSSTCATPPTRSRPGAGGGPGSGSAEASSPPGPRASATPRTTRCSTATSPTSAGATRAWSCSTSRDPAHAAPPGRPPVDAGRRHPHVHAAAGRDLLVVTDEVVTDRCAGEEHLVRLVDVSDPSAPRLVSVCPPPVGRLLRARPALRSAQHPREPPRQLPQRRHRLRHLLQRRPPRVRRLRRRAPHRDRALDPTDPAGPGGLADQRRLRLRRPGRSTSPTGSTAACTSCAPTTRSPTRLRGAAL